MTYPFEAKYISVNWADKTTVRSIEEARDSILIEAISKYEYKFEAVTYSKVDNYLYGQLAFHISDFDNSYIPAFKNSSGKMINLMPVENIETGKTWWIEDGKWKKKNKKLYKDSPLCRHAGEATIIFGDISCQIQIHSLSFTYDELELYLSDFRSDLWDLILKEDSYVSADVKTQDVKVATEELVEHINRFTKFVQKIIDNPKKELKESQSLQTADKVRPIPRTFMEIAAKGYSKLLTGRDYIESYDVAENQYIYAILANISILVDNLSKVSESRKERYEKNLLDYESRLKGFSDKIEIDKEVVSSNISDLEKKIEKREKRIFEIVKSKNDYDIANTYQLNKTTFTVTSPPKEDEYDNKCISMFVKSDLETNNYGVLLKFDKAIFGTVFQHYGEYRIGAIVTSTARDQHDGKPFWIIEIKQTISLEVCFDKNTKALKRLKHEKQNLERSEWIRPLTNQELREQEKERTTIERAKDLLNVDSDRNSSIYKSLIPISSKLHKLKKQLANLKIKNNTHFPGSMTFIQNPNYQGAHKLYKKVMDSSGLDNNLFDSLQETEKIGVLDIPAVYERWCLLQIIKILIEKFRFIPEQCWKQSLLQQVLTQKKDIVLNFKNNISCREVCLSYEKELRNGKRPDFVLDVTSSFTGEKIKHRFVIDAKFYEEIDISNVVNQLYNEKDYSEKNQNKVFILHPSTKAISKRKTPQDWSKHNYYGETVMFDDWCEDTSPDHDYGAIFLSPIKRHGATLDDLQRLIGMFLQYGLEDNKDTYDEEKEEYNPILKEKLFCISCGSDEYQYSEKRTPKGKKWWITCDHCSLFSVYSYCGSCKNRLIKNGQYWTYHATQALEPFNIKCPSCGEISMPRD